MEEETEEIARARALFPKMPPEVFDAWILPQIVDWGWPFRTLNDSVLGTKWDSYFCDLPFKYWAALGWYLRYIKPSQKFLHAETIARIHEVGGAAFGYKTKTAHLENTRERFWASATFIQDHGDFPPPPIIGDLFQNKLRIIDGHHRLAALFHVGMPDEFRTEAWLGSIQPL